MRSFTFQEVERLYQTSISEAFEATVSLVEKAMPIRSALFLQFRPDSHEFYRSGVYAYRVEPRYVDLYFEKYMHQAPIFATQASLKRMKANRIYFANRYIPDSILKSTAFYREFLKPQNQFYFLLSKLVAYSTPLGELAIHRSESMGRFENEEILELEHLIPHLARAIYYCLLDGKNTMAASLQGPKIQALTPTQQQIAAMILEGMSNREIAARMGIQEQSVKDHLRRIYKKLGVHSRTQMIAHLFNWPLA